MSSNQLPTVLMVEDSPTQAARLMHLLQSYNYKVVVATNAKDAIQLSLKEKPSLIVSDVTMPDMDGYEMCKALRGEASTQDIPVLLLTGLSDPEDIINGLDAGADCYLTKPYDDSDLLHRIEFVLHNRIGLQTKDTPIEIEFMGQTHKISSSRHQILGLLLSTYESAASQNKRNRKELLSFKMQLKQAEGRKDQAQKGLEMGLKTMASLLHRSPDPAFLLDDLKKPIWRNPACSQVFGAEMNQLELTLSKQVSGTDSQVLQAGSQGFFLCSALVLNSGKKAFLLTQGQEANLPSDLASILLAKA